MHVVIGQQIAKIEETMLVLRRGRQNAVVDLKLRDILAGNRPVKAGLLRRRHPVGGRQQPIAITDQTDQKQTAALDLIETHFEYLKLACLLGRRIKRRGIDTPPQIDRFQMMLSRTQSLLQHRQHMVA